MVDTLDGIDVPISEVGDDASAHQYLVERGVVILIAVLEDIGEQAGGFLHIQSHPDGEVVLAPPLPHIQIECGEESNLMVVEDIILVEVFTRSNLAGS